MWRVFVAFSYKNLKSDSKRSFYLYSTEKQLIEMTRNLILFIPCSWIPSVVTNSLEDY